jgi:5-enolpyruvylshikimate-3-phosphate synthase
MEDGLAALPRISSTDHRVVEALSVRCLRDGLTPDVLHPEAVNKSWPQFWDALHRLAA